MKAEIISIANNGECAQFLTHELEAYGISQIDLTTVGNDCLQLRKTLRFALSLHDLVIILGGPQYDSECYALDAVALVLGTPLVIHKESLERIGEYYKNTGLTLSDQYNKHAMLPQGSYVFPNDHGCTPGCAVSRYGQHIMVLPAALGELMPMFSDYVAPYLTILTNGTIVSRTVGVFGLSEAVLNARLADLMSEANPAVVSYAKDGEAILRITARAKDRQTALNLCNPVVEEVLKRLGVNVYGVDVGSLQKAVVALLLDKGLKIATAESCTAGLLSGRLTEVTGVSAVFECGIAAYSPEIKHSVLNIPNEIIETYGTVSPQVAGAMATGVRHIGNASIGVGITGVAGPDPSEGKPVGTVYIAVADAKRVWVKKIDIDILDGHPDRDSVRALATSHALDLVRRYLEAYPAVMAGGELLNIETDNAPPVIPKSDVREKKVGILKRIFPWKGDSKIEILRKTALWASAAILLIILFSFAYVRILRPYENQMLFRDLADLYGASNPVIPAGSDVKFPDGMLTQFYALYARNSDVRGWVKIRDTNINYPIMRYLPGDFYKYHNFDKHQSSYGVPYFSKETALITRESVNRSFVVYGNNTGDGQMFSDLTRYYNNIEFLSRHPVIEMSTIYKSSHWKIFSVMILKEPNGDEGVFDYTRSVFIDEADFLGFAGNLRVRSLYTIPAGAVDVQEGDNLLMLSTDFEETAGFYRARLVVAARQLRPGETLPGNLTGVSYNRNAVMPHEWPKNTDIYKKTSTTGPTTQTTGTMTTVTADTGKSNGTQSHSTTPVLATTTTTTTKFEPEEPTNTGTVPVTTKTTTTAATTTTDATDTSPPVTATTTSATTTSPGQYIAPEIIAGSKPESDFLSDCNVIIDGQTVRPKNKQELQMLLARIVKAEVGSSGIMANDLAAQKAQAIASYTYILYYNRTAGKAISVPAKSITLSNATDKKIYDAVGEVVGIKLLSDNNPVYTPYSASTPGFTANNHEVFYSNLEHLRSVPSEFETDEYMPDSWKSTCTVTMPELKTRLETQFGYDIAFESGKTPFFIKSFDKNGHYVLQTNAYYYINGVKTYVSGYKLRTAIGTATLRSHAFTVVSSTAESLTLSVTGYGHGVGMSQWGAANYAKYADWDYRQILSHYYSVTTSSDHRLVYPVW